MKKIFLLFVFLFVKNIVFSQCNYNPLGPDESIQPSYDQADYTDIAVDGSGIPYVVYQDYNKNKKCTVKKYNGNSWVTVGTEGFSSGQADLTRIAIDKNGVPYVIYRDYAASAKTTVQKFNGTNWVVVGNAGFSSGGVGSLDIAIDSSGTPYIVYLTSNQPTVHKFNGTSWLVVGLPAFSPGGASSPNIALDASGTPYVSFRDATLGNGDLGVVWKFNGVSWSNIASSGGFLCHGEIDLAVDSIGTPYVVSVATSQKCYVYKYNGTSWVNLSPASLSSGVIYYPRIAMGKNGFPTIIFGEVNATKVARYTGAGWAFLPSIEAGTWQSIALDSNDQPFITYSNLKCKVLKHNGSSWTNLYTNGFSSAESNSSDLIIDTNGTPYVAFRDNNNGQKCSVMTYNGTSWSYVGSVYGGISVGASYFQSIALDSTGKPYVAYKESAVYGYKASVMKYNGSNWIYLGSPGFTSEVADYTNLAIDYNGNPYIVYQEYTNGQKCSVMKFNGTNWVTVGAAAFSTGQAYYTDIAIDNNGTPFIVYRDGANSNKVTVMKFNGTAWVYVGFPGFSSGQADYTSIKVDSNGVPYVVFQDYANGKKCTVMKYNGSSWINIGSAGFSLGQAENPKLSINSNGTPYVLFSDYVNNKKGTIMKFDGINWVNVGPSGFTTGEITEGSLTISSTGKIYMTFEHEGLWAYTYDESDVAINKPSACIGDNVQLSALGGNGYSWVGPNGFSSSASSATITNCQIANSGTYSVAILSSTCPTSQTINLIVNQSPTVSVNSGTICNGTSYTLVPTGGLTYTYSSGSSIISPSISTTYTVSGADASGCYGTAISSITVNPSPTISVNSGSICIGDSFTFTPTGAINYTYSSSSPVITPSATSTYTIFGEDINGCYGSINSIVTVNLPPTLSVLNGVICSGGSYTLSAGGASSYTYSSGSPIITPTITTTYTIIGEMNSCIDSISSTVIVNTLPVLSIAPINSICINSSVDLNVTGANTYTWNTGATTSSITVTPTTTSVYTVTGVDLNNCSNTQTVSVVVDNTCQDVWPGDANSDGTADNLDVLELGLHYTQTGSPRASVSNTWQSYFANNWTGTITNGKNLNHSDCNGDGTIDNNDTLAIYNNYGLTHAFKPTQTNTVNPQLSIVPDQAYVTKGNWGTASIYAGDATANINTINGVAFTVDFDNTLIETNSIYIEYQNSFLDAGQNLHFRKLDFANSKLFTASTHTLNNNVSGFGKIATLYYQIKSSLTTDEVLNISLLQANQSNASGTIVPLTSSSGTLMAIGSSVDLQELNGNVISVSPNPTNGSLTINSKTELQKIEVVAITGQVLLSETPTNVSHTLHLDNFANGIYFVNLYQNNRIVKREKVVLNK